MAEIRLTKNELRNQQNRLTQLRKYLPTLQLKKAMLQGEVQEARLERAQCEDFFNSSYQKVGSYSGLLTQKISVDLTQGVKISQINRRYENIAGVEVPYFQSVVFEDFFYTLFDTPPWLDTVVWGLRQLAEARIRILIAKEKEEALERELRQVSIRVNLFEKILIPKALRHIKKIKVFLGDQRLAAVSQAKIAKLKIERQLLNNSSSISCSVRGKTCAMT